MIKIYPNALANGEPIETHEIEGQTTLAIWLSQNVKNFSLQRENHPINITVNDELISPENWHIKKITNADDIKITVQPKGIETIIIIALVVVLAVAIYHLLNQDKPPKDRRQGEALDAADINSNTVRWNDPIPEIAGNPLSYPSILVPLKKNYKTTWRNGDATADEEAIVFLCVGKGEYDLDVTDVFIGNTRASLLGNAVEINIYQPNDDVSGDIATDWWYTTPEIGGTTFGGTGLTLGTTSSIPRVWGEVTKQGATGLAGAAQIPAQWLVGMEIAPFSVIHNIVTEENWVISPLLDNASLSIGSQIVVGQSSSGETFSPEDYLTITGITPASGGSSGNPASITGNSSPSRFNFEASSLSFSITLGGTSYPITLDSDLANLNDLVDDINNRILGLPLFASASSNRLRITQVGGYNSETIEITGDYEDILGDEPVLVDAIAPTFTEPAKYIVNEYLGSYSGKGVADRAGQSYLITSISPDRYSMTVKPSGVGAWQGFPDDVNFEEATLSVTSASVGWSGPFNASPTDTQIDKIEVDIFYPQGLIHYTKKGKERYLSTWLVIEYRKIDAAIWTRHNLSRSARTPNQFGITYSFDVPQGEYLVRVAGRPPSRNTRDSDAQQWTGLKSRIVYDKKSYPNMTTMSVRLKTGNKIAGLVENRISVRARRKLPPITGGAAIATYDIAPFFKYLIESVGYGDYLDLDALIELDKIWKENGERFDLEIAGNSTLKEVVNNCLRAGFSEITIKNGLITPVRKGMRFGLPTRILSSQEFTKPLVQHITPPKPDDIDAIEVEYIEHLTGRAVTERFKLLDDIGTRAEKMSLAGVTGRTQALKHAERRRRSLKYGRITFEGETELQALNVNYLDYIGLQDTIPAYGQSAFVTGINGREVEISEEIEITNTPFFATLRNADGTVGNPILVEKIEGKTVTLALLPKGIKTARGNTDASVLYFGEERKISHHAIITEIRPLNNGRVAFKAEIFDPRIYMVTGYNFRNSRPYKQVTIPEQTNLNADIKNLYVKSSDAGALDRATMGATLNSLEVIPALKGYGKGDSSTMGATLNSLEVIPLPLIKKEEDVEGTIILSEISANYVDYTYAEKTELGISIDSLIVENQDD